MTMLKKTVQGRRCRPFPLHLREEYVEICAVVPYVAARIGLAAHQVETFFQQGSVVGSAGVPALEMFDVAGLAMLPEPPGRIVGDPEIPVGEPEPGTRLVFLGESQSLHPDRPRQLGMIKTFFFHRIINFGLSLKIRQKTPDELCFSGV